MPEKTQQPQTQPQVNEAQIPELQEDLIETKKGFDWRSLILPISILLTLIVVGLISWKIATGKKVKVVTDNSLPKIQKIATGDISFVKNENANYDYKAENKIFQAQFGIERQNPAVSFGVYQDRAITFAYQPSEKKEEKAEEQHAPVISTEDNGMLTFENAEKDVDLRYQTLPNGIKEEIVLKRARQRSEGFNAFVFESNFQGAHAQVAEDGTLNPIFYDEHNNYLFNLEKPFAIDNSGNRTDNVTYKIEKKDEVGNYNIGLIVDPEWLSSSERTYPIIIDPTIVRQVATGGTVTYIGEEAIHTFTGGGTFTVNTAITAEVLVLAGGGNGGPGANDCIGGGGGGGGGLIHNSSFSIAVGTFPVTVGGAGTNSVFSTLTAVGGGAGGITGGNGGSGGGSMGSNQAGGTATAGQGNNGGVGYGTYGLTCASGGGGGGAGGTGGSGTGYTLPGLGGNGTSISIDGTAVTYAVGGGGGGSTGGIAGAAGATNRGNGGGGGAGGTIDALNPYGYGGGGAGGTGGSGIVIIRYSTIYADVSPSTSCYIKENDFDSQLQIVWNDNSSNEDYFEVQRNLDGAGWAVLATTLAANSTSYTDSTVVSNHTYQYRVAPYIVSGPTGTPYYTAWCTTDQLNLGVGALNLEGLNIDGIDFN